MNRKSAFGISVVLATLLCMSSAFPQQGGIVEGRIVNGTDPAIVPGHTAIEVVSLSGGMSILRTAEADASGAFRIEGLPAGQMLMLRAFYKEAGYNAQIRFDDSGKARVELKVFEATTSMDGIRVEEAQMVIQAIGDHMQTLETVVLSNETDPPRTFMDPEGNFRFSKAPEIVTPPQIRITASGSSMPVIQSPLESPDGKSYYSLYPFRPGKTTVDVFQIVPYESRNYFYKKKFYYPAPSMEIGVIPMDMELSGPGLIRIRTEAERNLAVYRSGAIEAGAEVEWIFSGGVPVPETHSHPEAAESKIGPAPNAVGRNALIIGPLVFLCLAAVLWHAFRRSGRDSAETTGARIRQLKARRAEIVSRIAELDLRHEAGSVGRGDYRKEREEGMRLLRRIALLQQQKD